mgnify:CR=1 FL=1
MTKSLSRKSSFGTVLMWKGSRIRRRRRKEEESQSGAQKEEAWRNKQQQQLRPASWTTLSWTKHCASRERPHLRRHRR